MPISLPSVVRRLLVVLAAVALLAALVPPLPAVAQDGDLIVSAFRVDGPAGGNDEYIELQNTGDSTLDVGGWAFQGCAIATGNPSTRITFPAGTSLDPGQHLLLVNTGNNGYSGPTEGDLEYGSGIGNNTQAGLRIIDAAGDPVTGVGLADTPCVDAGVGLDAFPSSSPFDLVWVDDEFVNQPHIPTNSAGEGGPGDPDALSLDCTAPLTVTAGHAAEDGPALPGETRPIVSGKAIQATTTNGQGDLDYTVVDVTPTPDQGDLVIDADAATAEIRFTDDVPGLDPRPEAEQSGGIYTVQIEVTDETEETATCTVDVRVVPILDIGTMRGAVADDVNGRQHDSPYALGSPIFQNHPDHVAIRGVVTQRTLEENAGGAFDFEGFFLQSLDAEAEVDLDDADLAFSDGDPNTSDGVWVSMGTFSTLRLDEPGNTPAAEQYSPEPGDVITVRGPIIEDFSQTVMNNPFLVDYADPDDTGVEVPGDIEVATLTPPDDVQAASVYFERRAGMQTSVREGSVVVSANDFFSPSTSEFWVVDSEHPVAQREDPDHRRVFRDYHPLAHGGDTPQDRLDQNAYRIVIGSFGVKATEDDATTLITPVVSGQTLVDDVAGGLFYAFDKYQVMPAVQPELTGDHDPSASSLEAVDGFDPADEWSAMVYNVENLYDFRDDPFSDCDVNAGDSSDFGPNAGCDADEPGGSTVTPPYDYAPSSQEEYDEHRIGIAEQILTTLQAPDVITIQEAEKQDVCVPVFDETDPGASFLECDLSEPGADETATDNDRGTGGLDVLDELAIEIFRLSDGAVRYEATGDSRNGRDVRGITQGFLHRTDRVELVDVAELADDPVLGAGDALDIPYPEADERTDLAPWVLEAANPKAVNAVLPQSALDLAAELGESIDGGRFPQSQYAFSRAVQVAKFRIFPDGIDGDAEPVERYVTSNHMSAGPDGRTAQRTEQARLNAAVNEAARDSGGQVLNTGDFNVFPRPDDPFPAYKTDPDRDPSDQLAALYERGFINLHDVILEEAPENPYSFIFRGVSQILDHIFVDAATFDELVVARYIHVNTDFPADGQSTQDGRGASDHDPLYARFAFDADPAAELVEVVVDPTSAEVVVDGSLELSATAIYDDGTSLEVTGSADWTSADEAIAMVTDGVVTGVTEGSVQITASFEGESGTAEITVTDPDDDEPIDPDRELVEVVVEPDAAELGVGESLALTSTAVFDDDTTVDVTEASTWRSGDPTIATVTSSGLVRGVAEGTVEVTASVGGETGSAAITVTTDGDPGEDPGEPLPEGVVRVSGSNRFETAITISQATFGDSEAGSVVLARGDDFADSLAGTPLAVDRDAPVLLTVTDTLIDVVADEITRVLPAGGTVYLLGGTAALDASVEADLIALGYEPVRLAGPERIATSLAVANELAADPGDILITNGFNFPDALAAGAAGAEVDGVVVLTTPDAADPQIDAFLTDNPTATITAVGGPAARAYPDATPVFGPTRETTAVAVADAFFDTPLAIAIARQDDFADALAGGAHIGRLGGPLLLTPDVLLHPDTEAYLCTNAESITTGFVYGGTAAVSDEVVGLITARIEGACG